MAVCLPTKPGGVRWLPPSGSDTTVGYAPDADASLIYIYVNNLTVASWLQVLVQGDLPGRTVRYFLTWNALVEAFMDEEPDMAIFDSEKGLSDARSWFDYSGLKTKYVLAMHDDPDMSKIQTFLRLQDVLLMDIPWHLRGLDDSS